MNIKNRVHKLERKINSKFDNVVIYEDSYYIDNMQYTKKEFYKIYPNFKEDSLKVIEWV